MWDHIVIWWLGGGLFMPVMLLTSLVLYGMIGERWWVLYGPRTQILARRTALTLQLHRTLSPGELAVSSAWAKRFVRVAEEAELTSGFSIIRALTMTLPLLGLLGTVTGMVQTFGSLGNGPGAETARHASAGIGIALSSTQYGMGLAVPAMVCEWFLRKRVQAIVHSRDVTLPSHDHALNLLATPDGREI